MSDELKMIEVGGFAGVDAESTDELKELFRCDPVGTHGWVVRPYQEAAAIHRYDASIEAWTLVNRLFFFLDSGVDTDGGTLGLIGPLEEADTSLLSRGHVSSDASFVMQGLCVRMSPYGYTPKTTATLTQYNGQMIVNRDGVAREDTARIASLFADTFFGNAYVRSYEAPLKRVKLLGKADYFRGETPVRLKRGLVLPPSNRTDAYTSISVVVGRSVSVPRDKNFPPPEDGSVVVFTIRLELDGYFSTTDGHPLVTERDNAEARAAGPVADRLPTG